MRLARAVMRLFDYPVDDILAALPPAESELWVGAQFRQKIFRPHSVTRSIVFHWLDQAWVPGSPFIVLRSHYAPRELDAAVSACAAALEQRLDGKVAKLMLAELAAGAAVPAHKDVSPRLTSVHRCHVPVVTNSDVYFYVDDENYFLEPGVAYEFDNTRKHAVENRSGTSRVHLICDIMPASLIL